VERVENLARVLAGYLALLCYYGVAITGSRGGYLTVVGSLIFFAALSLYVVRVTRPDAFGKTALLVSAVAFIAIFGAILLINTNELLRSRLRTIPAQLSGRGQFDVRIYNWQAALDQIRLEPLFGTGSGSHIRYGRLFRRAPLQADPIHAHNDYLELVAEYGVLGAIGMAAFLFVHLRSGWRNYRAILRDELAESSGWQPARGHGLALTIGALSAVLAYLVHSITDFNLHVPGHALIFAFIFGILTSPRVI
jgi:O-antigen ligase